MLPNEIESLKIYTDGGARGNPGEAACAFVVIKDGKILYKSGFYLGKKTNNEAEYFGVIKSLEWLLKKRFYKIKAVFFLDSELITKQLSGAFKVKSRNLKSLFRIVKFLEKRLDAKLSFNSIPREKNKIADRIVNIVLNQKIKRN
ncbi:MAG: ribonuclease HI family protein [Candidatus Nitrosocaldaceae archaeon]